MADESVDNGIIALLRGQGFDVYSIAKENSGISDTQVLEISLHRKELLLTEDKDFGELTIRFNRANNGIILIRANDLSVNERFALLLDVLQRYEDELLQCFTVIDSKDRIRIRRIR